MAVDVSVLIPARNEQFLQKTIDDILQKAQGSLEIVCVLDGYWPSPPLKDDPRLRIIHRSTGQGMRQGINSAARIATGKYLMKTDAHCMFDEGFDVKLVADCEDNWLVVPRRKRLDAENWCIQDVGKPDIDYLYISPPRRKQPDAGKHWEVGFSGVVWREYKSDKMIDDLMTFQGSCWFMPKDFFFEMECLDSETYGTFIREAQELGVKVWLSGGRVIRNKKTWYAHLHKGKKYGRGYYISRDNIQRGSENIVDCWLNNKWPKQTRPLKWLIDKFAPVPGWENWKWAEEDKNGQTATMVDPAKSQKIRLHQNIEVEGEIFGCENPKRKDSKFWNKGKWENFIDPLLPGDCQAQTFIELGANAGLFLKLAKEKGFRDVIGIDKSRSTCKEAIRYRDRLGYDYKVLHRTLGGNFNLDELPVADVTLLANVHYYFDINSWVQYLNRLQLKTCYCLMVSRSLRQKKHWMAASEISDITTYFKHWEEVNMIRNVSSDSDPHPRNLFSLLFRSDLQRKNIAEIKRGQQTEMAQAKRELAREVVQGNTINLRETNFYKQWTKRKKNKWSENETYKFVQGKIDLMVDVKCNGLKNPLLVRSDNKLLDGGNRLVILEELGHKNVIVKIL